MGESIQNQTITQKNLEKSLRFTNGEKFQQQTINNKPQTTNNKHQTIVLIHLH